MKGLDSYSINISHRYGMLEKTATAASVCVVPTAILSSFASRLASYNEILCGLGRRSRIWFTRMMLGVCVSTRAVQLLLALMLIEAALGTRQIIVPDRHARLIDVATKIAGGSAGAQAIRRLAQWREISRWL
jgi:hypothetical protein